MATYILVVRIEALASVSVGKHGDVHFEKGLCVYVGSARKGFEKRITRHMSPKKRLHWHIDYILESPQTEIVDVWFFHENKECETVERLMDSHDFMIAAKGGRVN